MSKSSSRPIGITLGDPCGIGPEVVKKALQAFLPSKTARFVLIGSSQTFKRYRFRVSKSCSLCPAQKRDAASFKPGHPNRQSAQASLDCLQKAAELLKQGKISALVTAPVSKEAVTSLGKKFHGHTEYFARQFGVKKFGMMFVGGRFKTVIVTRHIPVNRISRMLTQKLIIDAIILTAGALKRYFKIAHPAIAVCGLNPHAGEKGTIGKEEIRAVIPAIKKARQRKIKVFGPFSADTIFYEKNAQPYDAIIAMYHDQGLIPVKTLCFDKLVNLTMGLPFVRTSPAHGTAFDIAGKNKADCSSMREAIQQAVKLSK